MAVFWRCEPKAVRARRKPAAAAGVVAAACVDRANAVERAILARDDGGTLSNGSDREAQRRREKDLPLLSGIS
jgi:hypothetical protein